MMRARRAVPLSSVATLLLIAAPAPASGQSYVDVTGAPCWHQMCDYLATAELGPFPGPCSALTHNLDTGSEISFDYADRRLARFEELSVPSSRQLKAVTYTYDDAGRVEALTLEAPLGGSEFHRYSYDSAGRKAELAISGTADGPPAYRVVYSYDGAGRLVSSRDTRDRGSVGRLYLYDAAGRYAAYGDDNDGDGQPAPPGGVPVTYDGSGRVASIGITGFGYCDDGSLWYWEQEQLSRDMEFEYSCWQ